MRREHVPSCWYNVQSVYQIVTHDKITRNAVDIQNNEEEHQDESRDEMKNNGTFGSRHLAFMIPFRFYFSRGIFPQSSISFSIFITPLVTD